MLRHLLAAAALAAAPLTACASLNHSASVISGREVAMIEPGVLQGADVDVLAFAGVGVWRAVQAEGARLVELSTTSPGIKASIARADRIGTPLMVELSLLAESYGALKSIGRSGDAERAIVGAEIERLLPQANVSIRDFAATVSSAMVDNAGADQ